MGAIHEGNLFIKILLWELSNGKIFTLGAILLRASRRESGRWELFLWGVVWWEEFLCSILRWEVARWGVFRGGVMNSEAIWW